MNTLTRAVEIAKQHIPIQREVCKKEFWVGFTIVLDAGQYRVYSADAWERPTSQPMLPWSPPKGTPVAHVAIDGTTTLIE